MTLLEHLDELRGRLLLCLAAVVVTSGFTLWKAEWLLGWLKRPAGDHLLRLAFFSPTEALAAYVKVGLLAGIVLALPVLVYQGWAFVRPAMSWRERAVAMACVWWGSVLFLAGAALAYGVVLPWLLRFLLSIGSPHLEPVLSIHRYLSFVLGVMLICGLACELPLVAAVLTRAGLVSPERLRRTRLVAWLVLLIAAALLTPTTDALTLILATIPLAALYELSIAVSTLSRRR